MWRISKKFILIDGYNLINHDERLRQVAKVSLESARHDLENQLSEFCAYSGEEGWVVYDATHSRSLKNSVEELSGIHVVFTKRGETADTFIERKVQKLCLNKANQVRVVTLDWAEQQYILGQGAMRVSVREWQSELRKMKESFARPIEKPLKTSHESGNLNKESLEKLHALLQHRDR